MSNQTEVAQVNGAATPKYRTAKQKKMAQLWMAGVPGPEIARQLGTTRRAVSSMRHALRLPPRLSSGRIPEKTEDSAPQIAASSRDVESSRTRLVMRLATEPEPTGPDLINQPQHYRAGNMEAIDVIEAFAAGNFHRGNALKYMLRAGRKGDAAEDLRKAIWYIEREIARLGEGH